MAYVCGRIWMIPDDKRVKRIDILSNRISKWILKTVAVNDVDSIINSSLLPLRIAREICNASDGKNVPSDRIINRIFESELTKLINGT